MVKLVLKKDTVVWIEARKCSEHKSKLKGLSFNYIMESVFVQVFINWKNKPK